MKIKLKVAALIAIFVIGGMVGIKLTKKPAPDKPGSSNAILLDTPQVQVVKINRRGTLEVTTPSGNHKIEPTISKNKIDINLTPDAVVGYSRELLHLGNLSINLGVNPLFFSFSLNYAINPHTEVGVGISNVGVVPNVKVRF